MTIKPRRIAKSLLSLTALIGLILVAAGVAIWFLLPPAKVAARSQLYVAPMPPQLLFPERNQVHVNNDIFLRSQAYFIRDRFVLSAALREPQIAELSILKEQPDPLQWLEKELKVEFPSPEIIHVSLSGDRPAEQLKIVSAVTKAYLENVVYGERTAFLANKQRINDVAQRYEERVMRKRKDLRAAQERVRGINEMGLSISQQVAMSEKKAVIQELTQVRQEMRHLQIELSLHPDMQKQEKLQLLKAMEKGLLADAVRLDQETKPIRTATVDLSLLKQEIENDERVLKTAQEKLSRMEVEQDAAPRITQPDNEAVLVTDPTRPMWVVAAAAAPAGLGILFLAIAVFRLRAHKANNLAEHSPPPSLPE